MTLNQKLNKLKRLALDTMHIAYEMADLIVSIIDKDSGTIKLIAEKAEMDHLLVSELELIGRKTIIPELVFSKFPARSELRKMPYSEQKRLYNGTVDVLDRRTGETSSKVKVKDLVHNQVLMVFDNGKIRDLIGQRAYIDGKRQLNPAPKIPENLEIIDKKEDVLGRVKGLKYQLKVTQGCKINWDIIVDEMPAHVIARIKNG